MRKVKLLLSMVRQMGLPWVSYRGWYEFRKKTGILEKRFPAKEFTDEEFLQRIQIGSVAECVQRWRESSSKSLPGFLEIPTIREYLKDSLSATEREKIIRIADQAILGRIYCFSHWYADYGMPINWQYNPVTKKQGQINQHWTRVNDLDHTFGDIKYVWEASRFPQVYYFVKAHLLTGDPKYPAAFWDHFSSWVQQNPPELGLNWKCGQELTIRMISWIFGLYAFYQEESFTEEMIFAVLKQIYYHAQHIDRHFEFALHAVKNNHTISEAGGIFTAGVLFPFMDKNGRWLRRGRRHLEREGLKQIYTDGSYLQHSLNYQRLIVQMYSWVLALAAQNQVSFGDLFKKRLLKTVEFLYQAQGDGERVPNYGSNDGALLFPLSTKDYLNYAPQLNTLHYLLTGQRLYPSGKADDEMIWFAGMKSLLSEQREMRRSSRAYPVGGYFLMRGGDSYGWTRCCEYHDRPAQADMLHLDLWWKGQNVLRDAGSFSYNPGPALQGVFTSTAMHNTVVINGQDQMQKSSRFLWENWTQGRELRFNAEADEGFFQGEHYGYHPIIHRRSIAYSGDIWLVVDDLMALQEVTTVEQNWHLGHFPVQQQSDHFRIETPEGNYSIRFFDFAPENERVELLESFVSLYYGEKQNWPAIRRIRKTNRPCRLFTLFYPEDLVKQVTYKDECLSVILESGRHWTFQFCSLA